MAEPESKLLGAYLLPRTLVGDAGLQSALGTLEFWQTQRRRLGDVPIKATHASIVRLPSGNTHHMTEEVLIATDGLIACGFDSSRLRTDADVRAAVANHLTSFVATVYVGAGALFFPINEGGLFRVASSPAWGLHLVGVGGGPYTPVAANAEAMFDRWFSPKHELELATRPARILHRSEPSAIHDAITTGDRIRTSIGHKTVHVMLLEAAGNYALHRWNNALLFGWSAIEALLGRIWNARIVAGASGGRKESLLRDYRTYTAAVRTEVLFQSGVLAAELRDALNGFRKARNDLVHEGESASYGALKNIFHVVNELVGLVTGEDGRCYAPPISWTSGIVEQAR